MDMIAFLKENGLYEKYLMEKQITLKPNAELIEKFVDEQNYSDQTKEGYTADINYFIQTMEIQHLQKVTSKTIYKYQKILEKSKEFGVSRKKRLFAAIRSFYKFFKQIGRIFPDEFDFVEYPEFLTPNFKETSATKRSNKDVVLTLDETKVFLKRLKLFNFKDYLMSKLMAGSGMRIGDVINIELDGVDFEKQQIRTKTKSGIRVYFFNQETKEELQFYLQEHRLPTETDCNNLFLNHNNEKIKPKSYTRQFTIIARKKLRCENQVSCHTLRRTFGTIRSQMGQDESAIGFLLGHISNSVTSKYIKKSDEEKLAIFLEFDFLKAP